MKTFILTTLMILFIGLTSATFAQTNIDSTQTNIDSTQVNIDSTQTSKYVYCELVGIQKFLSTKVNVSIDYGEERSFFQDTRMKDEQTGKVHAFNSMVDALNYMGNNGWEFVQAYVVTMGQQNVYHWLLKKKKE